MHCTNYAPIFTTTTTFTSLGRALNIYLSLKLGRANSLLSPGSKNAAMAVRISRNASSLKGHEVL